ncbi:MAG: hypothetical protein QW745_09475 [Thermoplasmata archaeon]
MSTRCQIRFEIISQDWNEKVQIYRHYDGYPEAVIQDLKEFYDWYLSDPWARDADPPYEAADFIFFMKLKVYKMWNENGIKNLKGSEKNGYGVENVGENHGDEDYLYRVVWDKVKYPNEKYPRIYVAECPWNVTNGFDVLKFKDYGPLDIALENIIKKNRK